MPWQPVRQPTAAGRSAQEAYNRVDTLTGVVANLDNYKATADINVTFAFDKAMLTVDDKKQLDDLAANLQSARGYILEVTGGTDTTGDANYNYQLSQRRADAVVNYLATNYNIPPHKFYLVGIGKDQQVADNTCRRPCSESSRRDQADDQYGQCLATGQHSERPVDRPSHKLPHPTSLDCRTTHSAQPAHRSNWARSLHPRDGTLRVPSAS